MVDSAHGWRADNLPRSRYRSYRLSKNDIAELESALVGAKRRSLDCRLIERDHFHLARFSKVLEDISHEIETGLGFFLIRGIPVQRYAPEDLTILYWGIARYLGAPVTQNRNGDLLSSIRDSGKDLADPTVRGHETSAALPYHSDRCDTVLLLCIKPAYRGGISKLVSAIAVYNHILAHRPDLAEILRQPFPNDKRDGVCAGERPWALLPIFGWEQSTFAARYVRRFVEGSQRFSDAPRLTQQQIEALDYLDSVINEKGFALSQKLSTGDLQIINNHIIFHSRTSFKNHKDSKNDRLLLRLWLASPKSRPLPRSFGAIYGSTAAGALRGGVIASCDPIVRRWESNPDAWEITQHRSEKG